MKTPKRLEIRPEELQRMLERVKGTKLPDKDYELIKALTETVTYLSRMVEEKKGKVGRLLRMIFGVKTEKKDNILKTGTTGKASGNNQGKGAGDNKKKPKGHGRNGSEAYGKIPHQFIKHQELKSGDKCPGCWKGCLLHQKKPTSWVRVVGQAPITGTVFELQRLRCNTCGKIFTAKAPPEAGSCKYDESVGSMIALLKYGSGFPFYRLEKLEQMTDFALPASTQWDIVKEVADPIYPVLDELKRQGANGELIHNDDTTMKILETLKEIKQEQARGSPGKKQRCGIFTSGIVSLFKGHRIALFFTGRRHAGENLGELLKQRSKEAPVPIQMCDALERNVPKEFKVVLANCLAHGRRQFVDAVSSFPEPCRYVIEALAKVYKNFSALINAAGNAQITVSLQDKKNPTAPIKIL